MFNVLIKFTLNCVMANGLIGHGSVLVRSPYVKLDISVQFSCRNSKDKSKQLQKQYLLPRLAVKRGSWKVRNVEWEII